MRGHRRESVRTLQAALRLAGWLGARGIDTGPGSMNPAGPWAPAPRQLDAAAPGASSSAACANAPLLLQTPASTSASRRIRPSRSPHRKSPLDVLDAVDSPWVRLDYDSANWINLYNAWDTTAAINHHFDLLGEHIVSCHAKDAFVEDRLVIHISDGCAGRGLVDFRTLCRRMHMLSPDYPIIIEGAETEDLPEVSAFFHGIAAELDIPLLDADEEAAA